MTFTRQQLAEQAASLAVQGVYVGTSSWKYQGWCGLLYDRARYEWRGKFAESRFKKGCLAEYAEVFKTVCVDAAYYTFPSSQSLEAMTLHESIRANVGLLMFEFSRFWPTDYEHGRDFISDLDRFFGQLPSGWPYGVEMRNRNWLKPEYFECLARHRVTHVYNSWEAMPPVGEQMALPGSRTNPELVAARFLLKPGRKYEEAVKTFEPYEKLKEKNPEARAAGKALIAEGQAAGPKRKTFIFVNNRLEGNALGTIAAMAGLSQSDGVS